jgi:hypothetical protein
MHPKGFMAAALKAGVRAPLIEAGREVGRDFIAQALDSALVAAQPQPPRASWDVPESPLSDDERRSVEAFRAAL